MRRTRWPVGLAAVVTVAAVGWSWRASRLPAEAELVQAIRSASLDGASIDSLEDAVGFSFTPSLDVRAGHWQFRILRDVEDAPAALVVYSRWWRCERSYGKRRSFRGGVVVAEPLTLLARVRVWLGTDPYAAVAKPAPAARRRPSWAVPLAGTRFNEETGLPDEVRDRRTGLRFALVPRGYRMRGGKVMWFCSNRRPYYLSFEEVPLSVWRAVMGGPVDYPKREKPVSPQRHYEGSLTFLEHPRFFARTGFRAPGEEEYAYASLYFADAAPAGFRPIESWYEALTNEEWSRSRRCWQELPGFRVARDP